MEVIQFNTVTVCCRMTSGQQRSTRTATGLSLLSSHTLRRTEDDEQKQAISVSNIKAVQQVKRKKQRSNAMEIIHGLPQADQYPDSP